MAHVLADQSSATWLQSTAALPFGTIVIILVIWALVTFPLTVLGGIAGKNTRMEFNAPCRTTKCVSGILLCVRRLIETTMADMSTIVNCKHAEAGPSGS